MGVGLAFSQDFGNILLNPDADWRSNTILAQSSEQLVGKIAADLIEKEISTHNVSLAGNRWLAPTGLIDDLLHSNPDVLGSVKGIDVLNYAKAIRGTLAAELTGTFFDLARGKQAGSPDMADHYADLLLTGLWTMLPPTRFLAGYIGDFRDFASEATRGAFEAEGQAAGESNPGAVAEQLYQIAGMALHGVDPSKTFAYAQIDALDRVPGIAGNADYQALVAAFESGDKPAAAKAFKNLNGILRQGGISQSTIDAMENALTGSSSAIGDWTAAGGRLGGVSLRAIPQWTEDIGSLVGVTYDKAGAQVVLVTESDRFIKLNLRAEDLAAAFAAMVVGQLHGHTRTVAYPQFSLDPSDPAKPDELLLDGFERCLGQSGAPGNRRWG